MADEPRTKRPEGGESGGTVVLGLLAPPQIPGEVVEELAAELPGVLSERVSDRVSWEVPTIRDERVPDVDYGEDEGIGEVREWKRREGWDLAVCMTDLLLLRDNGRILVAEASAQRDAAMVSLPALGPIQRRRRAREVVILLVEEVLGESIGLDREGEESRDGAAISIGCLVSGDGGSQLVATAGVGQLRLLVGMVRAARPLRVIFGLSYALVAALGTAALSLASDTIWLMADGLDLVRLAVVMFVSVATMVVYLIVVHDLWGSPSGRGGRELDVLFNVTTVINLTLGVLSLYAALFALTLVASVLLISSGVLGEILGHSAGANDYLALAWMLSSLATVGGAVGSGLESSAEVREAYYGYHQERHPEDWQGSG